MKTSKSKKKKLSGFSLVEMILVIAISAIIVLAVGRIFSTGMMTSQKNRVMQKNLEEARSTMEIMAKNIRMSQYTKRVPASGGSAGTVSLYMYNSSQDKCISYQFNNGTAGATARTLSYSECRPKKYNLEEDSPYLKYHGEPVGAINGNACFTSNAGDPVDSTPSCPYPAYTSVTSGKSTTGDFDIDETDRTNSPNVIGKATIRMTVGDTTDQKDDMEETLQTSVSFRDYKDIIQ